MNCITMIILAQAHARSMPTAHHKGDIIQARLVDRSVGASHILRAAADYTTVSKPGLQHRKSCFCNNCNARSYLGSAVAVRRLSQGNHSASGCENCTICLEQVLSNDTDGSLPCGHRFHSRCALELTKRGHLQCPLCRERFQVRWETSDMRRSLSSGRITDRRRRASPENVSRSAEIVLSFVEDALLDTIGNSVGVQRRNHSQGPPGIDSLIPDLFHFGESLTSTVKEKALDLLRDNLAPPHARFVAAPTPPPHIHESVTFMGSENGTDIQEMRQFLTNVNTRLTNVNTRLRAERVRRESLGRMTSLVIDLGLMALILQQNRLIHALGYALLCFSIGGAWSQDLILTAFLNHIAGSKFAAFYYFARSMISSFLPGRWPQVICLMWLLSHVFYPLPALMAFSK
eukprot:gnl/TRDRNA2_/TRDRNA2_28992_c0_seq1.p1 gnl/TRDRNA2_/TRDRNA2_28992_c0~~gnl/TRDRNA2_/TRDRNA2_28992_c0_seq1.p1  ORF type:complete len:402 (-),score=28.25 gnl/TRDRNA2_/TRDRNA2_28992_c0_seq1:101-1306(-)